MVIDHRTLWDGTLCVVSEELETINEGMICERSWCPWNCKDGLEMMRCRIRDLGVLLPCIEEDGMRGINIGLGDDDVWEF